VDPVVIFKMSLLGYFYGISSERRLAEECKYNLAFKWFLHYDIDEIPPDHSIFSKARARYGKQAFEQFFAEIVRKCAEAGLIDGSRLFVDATLLKANASRKSLLPRDSLMELKQSPREYIESLWRENPTDGADSNDRDPPDRRNRDGGRRMRSW
jgi:transposase